MNLFRRAAATALTALAASASAQKNLDIFLLIGQSNMAGRGDMIASDSTTDIAGAWLLKDTSGWEPARNPLNRYSTAERMGRLNQVGPGFGFAMRMHQLLPKTEFGLVVNAKGGSALKEWAKGSAYYDGAVARTRYAMRSGTLKAILWHQGEADRLDTAYVTRVSAFIDTLRKEFGRPDLPFIAGQLGAWGTKYSAFNALIPTLPARKPHTAVVRTDSLTHKGDSTHFDRPSTLKLGERYAEAVWKMAYGGGNPTGMVRPADARGIGRGLEAAPLDLLGRRGLIDIPARQLILYPRTDRE